MPDALSATLQSRFVRASSSVASLLRWRGPFVVVALALKECLRPLMQCHVWYIFETDIADRVAGPYVSDGEGVTLETIMTPAAALDLRARLPSLERLAESEIVRRLTRGDALIIATRTACPVGSMWVSFVSGVPLAFDATWKIGEQEAVRYDSYVVPAYRGRRIHSLLNFGANGFARSRGVRRTFGSISILNRPSLRLAQQHQRAVAMIVVQIRLRGRTRSLKFATGRKFDERFGIAPESAARPQAVGAEAG
jgi:hypothetical protein